MQNSFSYFFSSSGWSETESTQYMIHNRQDNVDVIKYTTKNVLPVSYTHLTLPTNSLV